MCLIDTKGGKLDEKRSLPSSSEDIKKDIISTHYTVLHGKTYDFTKFKHPGGDVAIALAHGRDATEMFEVMHQFSSKLKLEAVLKKYEVVAPIKHQISLHNIYDWDATKQSDFTKELQEMARTELPTSAATKATAFRIVEIFVPLIISIWMYYQLFLGSYVAVFTFPVMFWIFTANAFHDGSHFAVSMKPWINHLCTEAAFLFSAPYTWYHQHIVGHHSFPNVQGKDPDLYHSPKFTRHSSDIRVTKFHSIQAYIFPLVWAVGIPLGLILRGSLDVLRGKAYNKVVQLSDTKELNRRSLYPRLLVLFLTLSAPVMYHGLTVKGVIFSILPYLLYSMCFMVCSQINHLTPETDEQFNKNFYMHQILTGHNVAIDNYWVYLFTGGLNMQIEHHLFPSVNHCHLRALAPKVKALCKKHGVQYNESTSLFAGLSKHVQHMFKFSGVKCGKKQN